MRSMSSGDIFAIIFCAASIICGFIILPVRGGALPSCTSTEKASAAVCASSDSVGRKLRTCGITAMNENYPTHLAVANQNDTDRDGVRLRA